jgi:sugar O-acyltransferase (sialic acid O-acetyltransferase NeuD family)
MKGTIGMIGAGGHAKVVADAVLRSDPHASLIFFSLDAPPAGGKFYGFPHYRERPEMLENWINRISGWHVAIGDPRIRASKTEELRAYGARLVQVIHPDSIVSPSSTIGPGSFIAAGAIVNAETRIGAGCIINTAASVDHDCVVGDYVNVGPGSRLTGGVHIGRLTELGSGTVIIPGIKIGKMCTIGAGTVVIRDLPDCVKAVGVPARIIGR